MFVGEAPGIEENKRCQVFIGKTGRELNEHYLPLAGLRRESCYVTNAIKCLPISAGGKLDLKRASDSRLLSSCAFTHLYQEIATLQPVVIVPMGAFACAAVDPELDIELHHGYPRETQFGIPAFPMHHPARGMHEPKLMLHIRNDWMRLRSYLAGVLSLPVDDYPTPDYCEVTDGEEIDALDLRSPLACDTESSPRTGPVFLTYSSAPGTARLIRADRRDLLERFQSRLDTWESQILFHNWLYDAKIVRALGLRFPHAAIRDTMVLAFHLGNLPQGLKALAWRELGMVMQDFEDVVKPHSVPRVLDYYRRATEHAWVKPEAQLLRDETGAWKVYSPQSMATKLKRFFTDYGKNPEKDVFKMFEDNWVGHQAELIEVCGEFPGMDISHVPFEQALYYSCRDADATRRLYPHLLAMRARANQGLPQDRWRAA